MQCYHHPVSTHSTLTPWGEASYQKGTAYGFTCITSFSFIIKAMSQHLQVTKCSATQKEDRHQLFHFYWAWSKKKRKEVEQDNVERAYDAKTGKERRKTIRMWYIYLSAVTGKSHVLKTVLTGVLLLLVKIRSNHTGRGWRSWAVWGIFSFTKSEIYFFNKQ